LGTVNLITVQIALKLDDAVVRELDELVGKGIYESRSDAVRRAVDRTLALHRRREIDDAFRAGFAADPDDRWWSPGVSSGVESRPMRRVVPSPS
jgi:Arc/MetJ-type ribon-helix-helix transcriptional regulator